MTALNLILLISLLLVTVLPVAADQPFLVDQTRLIPSYLAEQKACNRIKTALNGSTSSSFGPSGSQQYKDDIFHWAASSRESATCTVRPGNVDDLQTVFGIIREEKASFAIKGGGHSGNKGFSSTTGVLIAMKKMNKVEYKTDTQFVEVGAGALWDEVYEALNNTGRHVVGGRVKGVGVGGFTLGGGYSWLSNQYGLTIDTVQAFDIVLPNGTFTTADAISNSDLFFALRGGGNRFGIVTKFTFKTFPRDSEEVWGGYITYRGDPVIKQLVTATVNFCSKNKDPKAAIITNFVHAEGLAMSTVNFFYDGPDHNGIFSEFLKIPARPKDMNVTHRSFLDLVRVVPSDTTANIGLRGVFNTGSVRNFSDGVVSEIAAQSEALAKSKFLPLAFVNVAVESFLPTYFDTSQGGAYPHSSDLPVFPLFAQIGYEFALRDTLVATAIQKSIKAIVKKAVDEGQDVSGSKQLQYSNYALPNTTLTELFGENADKIQQLRQKYDPGNVMSLTGGFKFP